MANQMSNLDIFDIGQISFKLAQRWHLVCSFYCKKIRILGNLDNAENSKKRHFFWTPYIMKEKKISNINEPCCSLTSDDPMAYAKIHAPSIKYFISLQWVDGRIMKTVHKYTPWAQSPPGEQVPAKDSTSHCVGCLVGRTLLFFRF